MDKKSAIIGMPLMAIKEGEQCGTISQLVVDTDAKRVTHFVVGGGKGLLGTNMAVPVDKLLGVGRDFVTLQTKEDLQAIWKIGEGLGRCMIDGDLVGLSIISSKGDIVGKVEDFTFEAIGGALGDFLTDEGDTIASSSVLTVAPQGLFVNFNGGPAAMGSAAAVAQPQVPAPPAQPQPVAEAPKAEPVPAEPAPAPAPAAPAAAPKEEPKAEPVKEAPVAEVKKEAPAPAAKAEPVKTEPKAEPKKEAPKAEAKSAGKSGDGEDYFLKKQSEYLIGRKAKKDIAGSDGSVLVAQGEEVTAETIEKTRDAGKLTDLMLNVE